MGVWGLLDTTSDGRGKVRASRVKEVHNEPQVVPKVCYLVEADEDLEFWLEIEVRRNSCSTPHHSPEDIEPVHRQDRQGQKKRASQENYEEGCHFESSGAVTAAAGCWHVVFLRICAHLAEWAPVTCNAIFATISISPSRA
jgi:hypothetical protein